MGSIPRKSSPPESDALPLGHGAKSDLSEVVKSIFFDIRVEVINESSFDPGER